MKRNASLRVVVTAACSITGLALLQCSPTSESLPPPAEGGTTGHGGTLRNDASLGDGGRGGNTGPIVTINLDLIPASWGGEDAPKGPEVSAPSPDSNCGMVAKETVRKPADVMLVLDASQSMEWSIEDDCTCSGTGGSTTRRQIITPGAGGRSGTGGRGGATGVVMGRGGATGFGNPMGSPCDDTASCKTRLESIKPAVSATLAKSTYVNWGLKLFPSDPDLPTCEISSAMDVPVAAGSGPKVQAAIDGMELVLGTPTAQALIYATDYLKTLNDGNQKFILLATDGEPNCKGGDIQRTDTDGAAAAAAAAKAAGFPVYVVGIGPNLENLTEVAKGGGTKDYYPVSSPQQLVDALSSITKIVGSCTFTSEPPPDPQNVAVYVNKQLVEKSDTEGWTYGSSNAEIKLTGSYCAAITAGEDTAVQILFGCPGAPPFPTHIP